LHNNTLTGTLPAWLGDHLPLLEKLNLAYNKFTGDYPVTLTKIINNGNPTNANLHTLNLGNNHISIDIASLQSLTNLQNLFLQDNQVNGELGGDWILAKWSQMQVLDLSDNFIIGSIPVELFEHPSLTVLDLHGNLLTDSLEILTEQHTSSSIRKLEFLALSENSLTGAIPSNIGLMTQLRHLDLSRNQLDSAIPEEIYKLTNLVYLFLAFNEFEAGGIPAAIGDLDKLVDFSLKKTNRNGPVPTELGQLSNLVLLDLDGNDLDGEIPASFGDLENLRFLFLSHNLLDGEIPNGLGELTRLETLLVHSNALTGKAPDGLCATFDGDLHLAKLVVIMADCTRPEDNPDPNDNEIADSEVDCPCCTLCCKDSDSQNDACNNNEWYGEMDPIWDNKYTRMAYIFNEGDIVFPVP
jgi:Leucine-rich repeat (LRR) protein